MIKYSNFGPVHVFQPTLLEIRILIVLLRKTAISAKRVQNESSFEIIRSQSANITPLSADTDANMDKKSFGTADTPVRRALVGMQNNTKPDIHEILIS